MLNLIGEKIVDKSFLHAMVPKRCLCYYDGPLLSEYEADNGERYLVHWCDRDESMHRWMYVRVVSEAIQQYVDGDIALGSLIPYGSGDGFVIFYDFTGDIETSMATKVNVADVPNDYHPQKFCYNTEIPMVLGDDTE